MTFILDLFLSLFLIITYNHISVLLYYIFSFLTNSIKFKKFLPHCYRVKKLTKFLKHTCFKKIIFSVTFQFSICINFHFSLVASFKYLRLLISSNHNQIVKKKKKRKRFLYRFTSINIQSFINYKLAFLSTFHTIAFY